MVLSLVIDESYLKITLFSFECISSSITLLIFSHLFYQIYGKEFLTSIGILKGSINDEYESSKLTIKTTKIFSTVSVLFYSITTIFLTLHHSASSDLFFFSDLTVIISDVAWVIGQTSCYLLWITRLYWTFEGSIHQSSNRRFFILGSLVIIFAFGMASAQILFIMKHSSAFIYYAFVSIIVCFIDLILSSIVMYTFLYKLHDLTAHCQSNWIVRQDSDYRNDIKQIKMIKAESCHFKKEKKAFKTKFKQKKHRVINKEHTCSRLLNDISSRSPTTDDDTLISNIIAAQTPLTYDAWSLSTNPMQIIRKSKSVCGKPKTSKHSSSPFRFPTKQKSKSAASKDESFNFKIIPQLFEMERIPINGYNGHNGYNYNNNDKQTLESTSSDLAMIDIFDAMKSRNGRETDSTLTSVTSVPIISPQQLTEIVRSPSVFDRYRENLSLDDRQKLLVVVMTKYTILAVSAVVSTQLFVIVGFITTLVTYDLSDDDYNSNIILFGIYYFIWNIHCIIGSLCCYLSFKMNAQLYHKLCLCCNTKCRQICAQISKNKIINEKINDRAQTLHQYLLDDVDKDLN